MDEGRIASRDHDVAKESERAIAGEFTPEKLEEMRRNLHKKPEKEEYAHFAKLHPGVEDDEDLED